MFFRWQSNQTMRKGFGRRFAGWRVGNGKSIKIWQHHWLPQKHLTKVLSLMVETMEKATVDCLIDEGTRTWNVEMVDEIFAPQEAKEIKKYSFG